MRAAPLSKIRLSLRAVHSLFPLCFEPFSQKRPWSEFLFEVWCCVSGQSKRGAEAPLKVVCGSFAQLELDAEREFKLTRAEVLALAIPLAACVDGAH
jgi:hypothetical protein